MQRTIGFVTAKTPYFTLKIRFLVWNLTVDVVIEPVNLATGIRSFVLLNPLTPGQTLKFARRMSKRTRTIEY